MTCHTIALHSNRHWLYHWQGTWQMVRSRMAPCWGSIPCRGVGFTTISWCLSVKWWYAQSQLNPLASHPGIVSAMCIRSLVGKAWVSRLVSESHRRGQPSPWSELPQYSFSEARMPSLQSVKPSFTKYSQVGQSGGCSLMSQPSLALSCLWQSRWQPTAPLHSP